MKISFTSTHLVTYWVSNLEASQRGIITQAAKKSNTNMETLHQLQLVFP
jgi:hypothetical protein